MYAVTIGDVSQFINVASVLGVTPDLIDINYNNPTEPISPEIGIALNEKNLAKIFKRKNNGLQLYRGDKNDLNNWTQIKLKDDNSIEEKNCK